MKIEIEKKYELTDHDYSIIRKSCAFISSNEIKDYYLDDTNYTLLSNNCYLRMRNGKYELKIVHFDRDTDLVSSEEYDNEEIINEKISSF